MAEEIHHEHLIRELAEQFEPVLTNSPQAIYLYLDDTHKICNQKFADMLGYSSVKEWVDNQFPIDDLIEEDQDKATQSYMKASENFQASTLPVTWVKKGGQRIHSTIVMVPITYQNEVFVLHFISIKS